VPSDLYSYIHQFLITNGLTKTAKYFKKETGVVDPVTPAGPDLIEIVTSYFKTNKSNAVENSNNNISSETDGNLTKTEIKNKKKKKRKAECIESDDEVKKIKKVKVEQVEKEEPAKEPKKDKKSKKGKIIYH